MIMPTAHQPQSLFRAVETFDSKDHFTLELLVYTETLGPQYQITFEEVQPDDSLSYEILAGALDLCAPTSHFAYFAEQPEPLQHTPILQHKEFPV